MKIQNLDENSTIGEIFQKYRAQKNLTTRDVAAYLKVKEQYILDLENDLIFTKKPALYVSGLNRSYAKFLKIDDNLLAKKLGFPHEKNEIAKKYHIIENDKYNPTQKQIIYSLLLLFISYAVFFYNLSQKDYLNSDLIIEKINNYDTKF